MNVIHNIDKTEKIWFHVKCPKCGKAFEGPKMIQDTMKRITSKELVIHPGINKIISHTTDCCNIKITYNLHIDKLIEERRKEVDINGEAEIVNHNYIRGNRGNKK